MPGASDKDWPWVGGAGYRLRSAWKALRRLGRQPCQCGGANNSDFYAIEPDGTLKWKFEAEPEIAGIWSSAALSGNGSTVNTITSASCARGAAAIFPSLPRPPWSAGAQPEQGSPSVQLLCRVPTNGCRTGKGISDGGCQSLAVELRGGNL